LVSPANAESCVLVYNLMYLVPLFLFLSVHCDAVFGCLICIYPLLIY